LEELYYGSELKTATDRAQKLRLNAKLKLDDLPYLGYAHKRMLNDR